MSDPVVWSVWALSTCWYHALSGFLPIWGTPRLLRRYPVLEDTYVGYNNRSCTVRFPPILCFVCILSHTACTNTKWEETWQCMHDINMLTAAMHTPNHRVRWSTGLYIAIQHNGKIWRVLYLANEPFERGLIWRLRRGYYSTDVASTGKLYWLIACIIRVNTTYNGSNQIAEFYRAAL